jgi:hypothetical protein
VRTAINNREVLFREQQRSKAVLFRVLREVEKIFTPRDAGARSWSGMAVVLYQA